MSDDSHVFVFEWEVTAPIELVFDTLADARTYPLWWGALVHRVQATGQPGVGFHAEQHCSWAGDAWTQQTTIVRYERPHLLVVDTDARQLKSTSTWTLTPNGGRVRIHRDVRPRSVGMLGRLVGTLVPNGLSHFMERWMRSAVEGLEPYLNSLPPR